MSGDMSTEPDTTPGAEPSGRPDPAPAPQNPQPPAASDKKLVSGILAILLGSLGIHKFYLGYQTEGIIMLAVTLVVGGFTCGAGMGIMGVVGLIEGIIYLTKTDAEFEATYVKGRKPWF